MMISEVFIVIFMAIIAFCMMVNLVAKKVVIITTTQKCKDCVWKDFESEDN